MLTSRFPYDVTATPNYQLTYIWFVQGTCHTALCSLVLDTLFYAFAHNLGGHLKIIQQYLIDLSVNAKNIALVRKEIAQIMEYHKHVLDMSKELIELYKPILASQFLMSSLQLCVIGYQLTLVRS